MEVVYADIELINCEDALKAQKNSIGENEVKRMQLNVLVRPGTDILAINEDIQQYMQFSVVDKREAQLADGRIVECDIVAPVEFRHKNEREFGQAIVLPENSQPSIGSTRLHEGPIKIPYWKFV